MFNCITHSWSHLEKPCPICSPIQTWTGSGTGEPPASCYKTISIDEINGTQFFGMQLWKLYEAMKFAKANGWKE